MEETLEKNQEIELDIVDCGIAGEGVGKYNNMAIFVPGAVPGDHILAGITKVQKNFAFARLINIITPSPVRVEPPCPVAKQCGGCSIQAVDYKRQLQMKYHVVMNDLIRISGFSPEHVKSVMEPIIGMKEPYRYRNKAQYPVGYNERGELAIGFYANHSHRIIETDDCLIGHEINKTIVECVRSYMIENNVPAYDEKTGKGLIRHILIRVGYHTNQIMVCLIINGKELPKADKLINKLTAIDGMTSICINENTVMNNVILGLKTSVIWGKPVIEDKIGDVTFEIGPMSFFQVNPQQTEVLYNVALDYAGLTGNENVWDLYCGIGTISLFLARKAKNVFGVEIIPPAVENARHNAEINNISNATFFTGKAEDVITEFYAKGGNYYEINGEIYEMETEDQVRDEMTKPDVIVVDPPRKGCDETCLKTMVEMAPSRIVYVSCDPATLARDLKYLCANGYELKRVRPVDQFCHSMHTETCCLLVKTSL